MLAEGVCAPQELEQVLVKVFSLDSGMGVKEQEAAIGAVLSNLDAVEVELGVTTDEMKAWDAEHGCIDTVYALSKAN